MNVSETLITIDRLKVFARHGVFPQESAVGNEFEVSVTVAYDALCAAQTDNIYAAVSYAAIVDIINTEMATPSRLIENVAWRIASAISRCFPAITNGTITISKLRPPVSAELGGASFTLRWTA
jgi:dihydroneopterin aldolase